MQLEIDVAGRRVAVVGTWPALRRALRRYRAAGAEVSGLLLAPGAGTEVRLDPALRPCPDPACQRELRAELAGAELVVLIGLDPALEQLFRTLAGDSGTWCVSERAATEGGSVTLVGGGPGDPALLTLAAVTALRDADAVLYDRLAPADALPALAPAAELVDVGKRPFHHPVSQRAIERQLVDRARSGQAVVRLKGGDPYVFGRGGEEVQACAAAGLEVRVVPGVSSAVAVPAAAGIPLTHRGISHAFTVISGHVPPAGAQYAALAGLHGTLVILMGIGNLTQITAGLLRAGLPADTPAAVIERGFSAGQRTVRAPVGRLAAEVRRLEVASPAVVVIGEVVRLAGERAGAVAAWADAWTGIGAA